MNEFLFIKTHAKGFYKIKFSEILYCAANGNYSRIVLSDGSTQLTCYTLKFWEDKLSEKGTFKLKV